MKNIKIKFLVLLACFCSVGHLSAYTEAERKEASKTLHRLDAGLQLLILTGFLPQSNDSVKRITAHIRATTGVLEVVIINAWHGPQYIQDAFLLLRQYHKSLNSVMSTTYNPYSWIVGAFWLEAELLVLDSIILSQ